MTERRFLAPLGCVYGAGMRLRQQAYDCGLFARHTSPVPVICIGNLSLGGTGKTPMVAHTAALLRDGGFRPAVVSRGYGRPHQGDFLLVSDGKRVLAGPDDAGDEPALLASMLTGVAVGVCADRHRAISMLAEQSLCDCVVLDDGFQHLRLRRDADIVLLDSTRRLADMRVFPAGTLRERPEGLRRASAVVHTKLNSHGMPNYAGENGEAVSRLAPGVSQFGAEFLIDGLQEGLDGGAARLPIEWLRGRKVMVFAGVANPTILYAGLRAAGAEVLEYPLRDHARFSAAMLSEIMARAERAGCSAAVATAKDAVKLSNLADSCRGMSLFIVHQKVELSDAAGYGQVVLGAVKRA